MELRSNAPTGPSRRAGPVTRLRREARQPRQPPQVRRHRRRHRPRRRRRRRHARRARLQREVLLLPGQPAPRALDRRAGRHQRREELPERRRQRPPPLLRHGEGRRLPRARVERLPPRRAQREHHRPVRRRRACRSRASTAACSTNRSFGGAQVSRTFYARGQTGQQLLLGAYQALERQIDARHRQDVPAHRDARPHRRSTGRRAASSRATSSPARSRRTSRDVVVLATGGYGNVFYLSTNAKGSQRDRHLARAPPRRVLREPLLHADPPDLHPAERRLPVEAHADDASRSATTAASGCPARRKTARRIRATIAESDRDYFLEERTRRSATSSRATSRRATRRTSATRAVGVGPEVDGSGAASTSTSRTRSSASAEARVVERYGNLFEMYERITGDDPYATPMRIYPATHYTMGGLWVDYNLMSTIPGLFVGGEANFCDHGANRLGASALMQGLADGYFVLPDDRSRTSSPRRSSRPVAEIAPDGEEGRRRRSKSASQKLIERAGPEALARLLPPQARHASSGTTAAWRRTKAGLEQALAEIPKLREQFYREVKIPGSGAELNQTLERALPRRRLLRARRADVPRRAPPRGDRAAATSARSTRPKTAKPMRDDENFPYVAAWEWTGDPEQADAPQGAARRSSTSSSPSAATSEDEAPCPTHDQSHAPRVASEEPDGARPLRDSRGQGHQHAHVVPRDARRA